jgi:mRNA interferase RelE/StbE
MLNVNFTKQAKKFLASLPAKQAKQLAVKIQELRTNPQPQDCKKLKGVSCLRVSAGEYRIIYTCKDETLEIFIIDKRNDDSAYKKMKRSL